MALIVKNSLGTEPERIDRAGYSWEKMSSVKEGGAVVLSGFSFDPLCFKFTEVGC
jgi:hypothetical protein